MACPNSSRVPKSILLMENLLYYIIIFLCTDTGILLIGPNHISSWGENWK